MTAQRFTNRPEQMWTYTAWQKKGVDTLLIVPGCAPRCPNTWGDKALTVYPLSAEEKAFMAKHNVRIVEVRACTQQQQRLHIAYPACTPVRQHASMHAAVTYSLLSFLFCGLQADSFKASGGGEHTFLPVASMR